MPKLRIFPFDAVTKGSNIAIYGSGVIFEEFLSQVEALNYCHILWVIDRKISESYTDSNRNIRYCSPDEMDWNLPDYIVIASIEYAIEIQKEIFFRKGDLDKVISIEGSNVVNIKADYKEDLDQQRKLIETGNIYIERSPALIVSLTSIPSRIDTVHMVIESLMQQSLKADSIILWLGEDILIDGNLSIKNLPKELLDKVSKGLVIKACKDIRSYKKLIPAVQAFSDAIIVTVDDDILFPSDWLEKLYIAYQKEPDTIHCHHGHRISFDSCTKLLPYAEWGTGDDICGEASEFILPVGCGGVLYPPRTLHRDVTDLKKAMSLCPTADDIWFKSMSLINKTKSKILSNGLKTFNYVSGTQDVSLCEHNLHIDEKGFSPNDYQVKAVFEHYDLFRYLNL